MIENIEYYISRSVNPYENLAIEKFLLDAVEKNSCILYLWQNKNTVVIGKNQNPWLECNCTLLEEKGVKIARRLSGGGAVYHDLGNLNFTFIAPTENYNLDKQMQVIKTACKLCGIPAEISGRNDITVNGRKFSGNAFYNSKGKAYHHGTLLINADIDVMNTLLTPPKAKLEAKGVKSVKSRVANLSEFDTSLTCEKMVKIMLESFEKVYEMKPSEYILEKTPELYSLAEKYANWDYIYGSTFPFTVSIEHKFNWGNVNILLQVEKGTITGVKFYTDSLNWEIAELVEKSLLGFQYEKNSVSDSLRKNLPPEYATDLCEFISGFIS